MKSIVRTLSIVSLVFSAATGCVDPGQSDGQSGTDMPPAEIPETQGQVDTQRIQELVNVYARSLVQRDVTSLRSIVSREILQRGDVVGMDLDGFLEKQRASMLRTFGLDESARPVFKVTNAVVDGTRIAVTLSLNGQELEKPTYFVIENGEMKLNVAEPGFSEKFRSESKYTIVNRGAPGKLMICPNKTKYVDYYQTGTVYCKDQCGWWSGTPFKQEGSNLVVYCDWNSWGADVIIDGFGMEGWHCNDVC